ncbi:MAG: ABC transporter permease subunit [Deltaproteobacteria bacterium]|nr:ABC transporter permease subunit [Deltaproteobacteria bacterium]
MSAWGQLLRLETRRLLRSPRGRAVSAALFVATAAAGLLGARLAAAHVAAGQADLEAARARVEARMRGDAPLSPVETALWEDTVVARGVAPLAALTAQDLAALPDAAAVRLTHPPTALAARAERSPAAALLGTFDVAWLLSLVLPLAVLGLGYDALARDRARGNLAALLAFAPSAWGLVTARVGAVTVAALVGLGPGLAVALAATGALDGPLAATDALLVLLLAAAAALAFSAATVAVSAFSARPGTALVAGLVGWAVVALALPLGLAAFAQAAYPDPDPRPELDATQAAQSILTKDADRLVAEEARRRPELDPERAADGVQSVLRFERLRAAAHLRRVQGAGFERRRTQARRAELYRLVAYLSPTTWLSHGLAALADTDPEARQRFMAQAEAFQSQLALHVEAPLLDRGAAPGGWPRLTTPPDADRTPALLGAALYAALAGLATALAARRLDRGALTPAEEDA